jgi:hypothetical protein
MQKLSGCFALLSLLALASGCALTCKDIERLNNEFAKAANECQSAVIAKDKPKAIAQKAILAKTCEELKKAGRQKCTINDVETDIDPEAIKSNCAAIIKLVVEAIDTI